MANVHAAGAAAAVIIAADDEQLPEEVQPVGGLAGEALGPFALISASSGAAVRQRAQQAPGLVAALAAPEGSDVCAAAQDSCAAEQPQQQMRALGLEVALTPQAHFWLGRHGYDSQAALAAAIKGLTDSLLQRQEH